MSEPGDRSPPPPKETEPEGPSQVDACLASRRSRPKLEVVDTSGEPDGKVANIGHTVLLVESDAELRAKVRDALPDTYELVTASGGEAAMRAARLCGPDVILFDPATGGEDILTRLQDDPLTHSIPVIPLLGRESGDLRLSSPTLLDPVARPVNVVELRGRITAAVEGQGAGSGLRVLRGDLGEASLEEVVDFVRREVSRWVLDAAGQEGASQVVHLGQSGQLMGALWAFIARLREIATRGSRGRISFQAHREQGRISMLTLSTAGDDEEVLDADVVGAMITADGIERLQGLRAVVADDDPAVRWAFSTVLGEVGVEVEAVADGVEALDAIERQVPDLVITDILMPRLDGWELIRRLRRDLLLRDVPVIVLSWKEDFLQRMRELEVNANIYMRKEVDRDQILLRLSSAMTARHQMEDRLREAEDEVAGRVEATGVVPLIRAVTALGGSRRLVVRETWNLFELDFDEGRLIRASNTSSSGEVRHGPDALGLLLGVSRGRFVVAVTDGEVEPDLTGDLERDLKRSARPLRDMIEVIAGGGIFKVARITLRPESLETYLQLAPQEVRDVVARLEAGEAPRELILAGVCGPQELELICLDLVRRGVVAQLDAPPPSSSGAPPTPSDEARWAVLGGELPQMGGEGEVDERPSLSSSLPPPESSPLPSSSTALSSDRRRVLRAWIILAIVALAAFLIGHCMGETAGPSGELSGPQATNVSE